MSEPQVNQSHDALKNAFNVIGGFMETAGAQLRDSRNADLRSVGIGLEASGKLIKADANILDSNSAAELAANVSADLIVGLGIAAVVGVYPLEVALLLTVLEGIALATPFGFGSVVVIAAIFYLMESGLSDKIADSLIFTANWLTDIFGNMIRLFDPLVFDMNGDGIQLTSLTGSNVYFDLDSDGFAERTGWVSASDGLLVRDNNGDGFINNGSELFGTSSRNGFEVLRALDSDELR